MPKRKKLKTPDWILEGYDSEEEYNKAKGVSTKKTSGKTFKIKSCPECGSQDVGVVLSNSDSEQGGGDEWECRKCKWTGTEIKREELTEDEFLARMEAEE